MERIVIVYGFEYEWKIFNNRGSTLYKSINTNHPIYGCHHVIEETEINRIVDRIKYLGKSIQANMDDVDKLANSRNKQASWKIAICERNLMFDVGYESEGDENGEPR